MNSLIETFGWTLIHFLWQAGIVAAVYWIAQRFVPSARRRYLLSVSTLSIMLICAATTAAHYWPQSPEVENRQIASTVEKSLPPMTVDKSSSTSVAPSPTGTNAPLLTETDIAETEKVAPAIPNNTISIEEESSSGFQAWLPRIVALWAAGVALLSLNFARSLRALRRLRSGASPIKDENAGKAFKRLLNKMGIHRQVSFLSTTQTAVPLVVGWLRPAVIIPAALFAQMPTWQIEAILAHELAHVRRNDYVVNLLQNIVETIFFYHPAVWWISGQVRKEREHCCDDTAAATCGDVLNYARALTTLEELRNQVPAGALSAAGGSLLARIRRLLGVPSRDSVPVSIFSWPIGVAVAFLAAGLLTSVHFVQGEEPSVHDDLKLPNAPSHGMSNSLLKRWQQLEEKESPIPELRVAGIRKVIEMYLQTESPSADMEKRLALYQKWRQDDQEHDAKDVLRLLYALAAEDPDLIQLAFNHEPRPGHRLEHDATNFGPAAKNGLRASWALSPSKDTYFLGDEVYGHLTLWNTGRETIMTGNGLGADSPGLRPELTIQLESADGRKIGIKAKPVNPVSFTKKWILKPGESAVIGGYRFKIGQGSPREGLYRAKHASEFVIPDLKAGERISMHVSFPYPKAPDDTASYPQLVAKRIDFKVADAKDMKVWALRSYGTWPMAGGVSLATHGENFHGADILTTAILTWPDERTAKFNVAADAFANREPWAIAWETGKPILWIASGDFQRRGDKEPPLAISIKRVDFSNPNRLETLSFNGWPKELAPSIECRRAMEKLMTVKATGRQGYREIQWATKNPTPHWLNILNIHLELEKGGQTFHIVRPAVPGKNIPDQSQPIAELEEALRVEAAKKMARWEARKKEMSARELELAKTSGKANPSAVIVVRDEVSESVLNTAIQACEAAGVGSIIARDTKAADATPDEKSTATPGEMWSEEKLSVLPFGKADKRGLRVARFFEPRQESYAIGARVEGRIVFHNTSREPIEFTTENWHQHDIWHCHNADGKQVHPSIAERMGFRAYPTFRLAPGRVCEVAAQGVKIGTVPYDEEPGAVYTTVDLPAKPGEEFTCAWDVTLKFSGADKGTTLRSGDFTFTTKARDPDFPVDLGIARYLGKYHLTKGVKLQRSQSPTKTTAAIEWENGARYQLDLEHRKREEAIVPIFWWRGRTALWIAETDALRKIDFPSEGEANETRWLWPDVPADFGDAPEKIRQVIKEARPPGKSSRLLNPKPGLHEPTPPLPLKPEQDPNLETRIPAPSTQSKLDQQTYRGRPLADWDKMLASGVINDGNREDLTALGYGSSAVKIPDAAIPMLLELVRSGQGATKCRCLGTLRKLDHPGDEVLDTVIAALGDEKSKGNRFRAGYVLGYFKSRSDYTVPRLIPLIQKDGLEQETSIFALGRIGAPAKEALPALNAIRPGASDSLMKVIDTAIRSIRDNAPQADDEGQREGILIMVNDAETDLPLESFRVLAGVPSGVSRQFEKEHNSAVVNWQPHTIKLGKDGEFTWPSKRGYAQMSLRIEAEGYVPHIIHGLQKGAQAIFSLKLKRDPGIAGSVQTPGGKRVAHDATVVLAMIRRNARLKGSTFPELALSKGDSLRDQWERPTVVQPDAEGRFTLPTEPDPTAVVLILHDDGVYVQPFADWKKAPKVVLKPWGRIHGHVLWGEQKGAGEKIDLSINRGDNFGYPDIIAQYDDTVANEKGRFVFERVLPGMAQLSCPIEFDAGDGRKSSSHVEGRITHANIQAPHTGVMIGGKGRKVMGRLVGFDRLDGITFRLHPNAPHFGRPGDEPRWAAWSAFKNSPSGALYFRDGLKVADDGTFEIPGILPGYYQIFFQQKGGKSNAANGVFRIPAETPAKDPEPFDAGEFKAR